YLDYFRDTSEAGYIQHKPILTAIMRKCTLFIVLIIVLVSCKKKLETIEVEKKTSWTEVKRFYGVQRFFLSSANDGQHIYLQQPFYFSDVSNINAQEGVITWGADLPTDISIRIPI